MQRFGDNNDHHHQAAAGGRHSRGDENLSTCCFSHARDVACCLLTSGEVKKEERSGAVRSDCDHGNGMGGRGSLADRGACDAGRDETTDEVSSGGHSLGFIRCLRAGANQREALLANQIRLDGCFGCFFSPDEWRWFGCSVYRGNYVQWRGR